MTREQLKGSYSEGEALVLYQEMKKECNWTTVLKNYLHDDDYQVTRNILWALTKATDQELSALQPMLHELIDNALSTDNSSVRRLTLNIILCLRMEEEDLRTDFLDFCLDHMHDPNEYPGIQSLCLKLAYRMCKFYPELMDELMRMLQSMDVAYYSPALRCVRNRILSGKKNI